MTTCDDTVRRSAAAERPPNSVSVGISIIIPTYNARLLLKDCLASIFLHRPTAPFEVIVVDDASSDGTAAMVATDFPQARFLRNRRNVNYARATNRGLRLARGRYLYLLNNDTVLLPRAVDEMVRFLDEQPRVGAVGSLLFNGDRTVQASVKTLPCLGSALFGARSPITKLFPHNPWSRRHLLHAGGGTVGPISAGYVSGASMMMRRELLATVGYLDTQLFYHVDADHCKRIREAGWEVSYLPTAAVIHLAHRGGSMVSLRRRLTAVVLFHRDSYRYFRKHLLKSVWHPLHAAVLAGLSLRFLLAMGLQVGNELGRCLTQIPAPSPRRRSWIF
jgi:GT2 family glycosyltransferase